MKAQIPIIVKDPLVTQYKDAKPTELVTVDKEKFLLDGPVGERVAVLDFDEQTGAVIKGADFKAPTAKKKIGKYQIADENDFHARDFQQVSVFGTVLKTMYMFEESDVLGRSLVWAFDSPQLLVIPRAGEWQNAFYERESHSLQFFYFKADDATPVYTCLSQDVVAHETAHAILDGIAPDLYHAITPQSLAMHEAIADLTAVMMAFRCRELSKRVLEATKGDIETSSVFSGMAEQFQMKRDPHGRRLFLRNLLNKKTLNPKDDSEDENDEPNLVSRNEPHDLSEVLSGALYSIMVKIYNEQKRIEAEKSDRPEFERYSRALWIAAQRFKRIIFRALDYLPPGEVSFADYGRAIIAADQATHPDKNQEREWITDEFVRRGIVARRSALNVKTNFAHPSLKGVDLQTLIDSDWAAYEFVNQNRKFLGVPDKIHFRVRPRLDTTKKNYLGEKETKEVREVILKVSWDVKERNPLGGTLPTKRQISVGTTLAIDWNTREVRALLSSDSSRSQMKDRDAMLGKLLDDGVLRLGQTAMGADGRWLTTAIRAETMKDVMRVRSSARMLHITAA
jgi:hypothetical protein